MANEQQNSDAEQVRELEARAALLKALLDKGTAKRPLIIEFSGLPKAGKTRSISVLELFLKRNGIKTEVFTERASIAPIRAKGHLNFNVWVSCASLQGMLEALYRDVDVFILDRGIFDALVWNEWLETTGKITREEAAQVAAFFTMDRWTELTDIVFLLTCDPKKSIEREYADQLTTKRGTIMSEHTLRQINEATQRTVKAHASKFKEVHLFDTTETSTREGVRKIAGEALRVLNKFLDESICVIPAAKVQDLLPESGLVADRGVVSSFTDAVMRLKSFSPRSEAEQNANCIQPIPCAILRYEDKILVLKRNKPGHPLHEKYDVWAGGHVSQVDDGDEILLNSLNRELSEEVFIKDAFELHPDPIALIRTNEDARASRHIAVLYEIRLKSEDVALALNQKEFRSTRGTSLSGRLIDIAEIRAVYREMGQWSKSIVDHLWPLGSSSSEAHPQLFST
jgi:predicted NUDIX family phosphoesterase/thymidylate kinase